MKKTKKRLTFGAFVIGTAIAATLTACHNTERGAETLYGPPNEAYDPSGEVPDVVYGPPAEEKEGAVKDETINNGQEETKEDTSAGFDPEENIEGDVYGPPVF